MRPTVPGYSIRPENRPNPKTFSYFYSLLPKVNAGNAQDFDPVEFRLRPLESRDLPVIFDQDSQFFKWFLRFEVANEYALLINPQTNALYPGGVFATANSNTITGSGTSFLRDFRVNDVIFIHVGGSTVLFFTVAQIVSDTSLKTVETTPFAIGSAEEVQDYGLMKSRNTPTHLWPDDRQLHNYTLTGVLSHGAGGTNAITGVGTLFLTELLAGDKFTITDNAGVKQFYIVEAITSNTAMTILGATDAAAASTSKAASKFYTDYNDIEFTVIASGGGGQRVVGQGRVLANQGTNGGGGWKVNPGGGQVSAIRRPYLYGKAGACTVTVKNLANDARRIHAHLFGARIRI